jgi:hypothetical protein
MSSKLRILVPVKRVIDYAVSHDLLTASSASYSRKQTLIRL